ncbi:MAG: hypothetical protein KDC03_23045 [Flavobacteriales bacterium]|nr:hypothetical protein [Flavobacteriales bacterium]
MGIPGIPDSLNRPIGTYESARWTGKDGKFWYFESGYISAMNGSGWGADLWRYDPVLEQWAWVKGPAAPNFTGNYGVQGVEDPNNMPPARGFGAATWTDTTGNLWLFGGTAYIDDYIYYSDLWRFDTSTENWTWINGTQQVEQAPIHGTQGVPDISSTPGSRAEMIATWTDRDNNLWLFGGQAIDSGAVIASDLWRYSIADNMWTWMKGPSTYWSPGSYGVQGVEDPLNEPSARWAATTWTDESGDLWLFGGRRTNNWYDNLNDLWRYRISTNSWTWMNGPPGTLSDTGAMGNLCEEDLLYSPSSRFECTAHWTDRDGNLWLWGGRTSALDQSKSYLNDIWKYDVGTNTWAIMGPEQPADAIGNFGQKGVPDPCNRPYGAMGNMGWYRPETNSIYLFGGYQFRPELPSSPALRSLMWRMELDTNCIQYPCPYVCDGLSLDVETQSASNGQNNGLAILTTGAGYAPYSGWLNGQSVVDIDTLAQLSPGYHHLVISDAFACSDSITFYIGSVNEGGAGNWHIHQQGASLLVDVTNSPIQLQAFDALGRLVLDQFLPVGSSQVAAPGLAQGIYVFRAVGQDDAVKLFME